MGTCAKFKFIHQKLQIKVRKQPLNPLNYQIVFFHVLRGYHINQTLLKDILDDRPPVVLIDRRVALRALYDRVFALEGFDVG